MRVPKVSAHYLCLKVFRLLQMNITYENIECCLYRECAVYVYKGILRISPIDIPYRLIDNLDEVRSQISRKFWDQVQSEPDESCKIKFVFDANYISCADYHLFPANTELKCELDFSTTNFSPERNLEIFSDTDSEDDTEVIAFHEYAPDGTQTISYYKGYLKELAELDKFKDGFSLDPTHGLEYGCIGFFHGKNMGAITSSNRLLLACLKKKLEKKLAKKLEKKKLCSE